MMMDHCGHYQPLSRRNEFAMINDYNKLKKASNNYMVDIKYYCILKFTCENLQSQNLYVKICITF
jgi:hypothetical protein